MPRLLDEIRQDASFIRSHALQPAWYKVLKVFILMGFLVGYYCLFGLARTAVFVGLFFSLSLLVHLVYRVKTDRWKRSWLDFQVVEEGGQARPTRIGKFYYAAVVLNATVSVVLSQVAL
jgi:hypothetical protein